MSAASSNLPAQPRRLCPACDYDLRGNISGRCPECGIPIASGPISSVPWVHRARRGDRRAFLETLWLLVCHPRRFAEESANRVQVTHARRFHHESIALATVLTTGALTVAFLLRGPIFDSFFLPSSRLLLPQISAFPMTPLLVLTDSLWFLLPLTLSVFLSLHISAALYRLIFAYGISRSAAAGRTRRRAHTLAYYASGLMAPLGLFLGGLLALIVARIDLTYPSSWLWRILLPAGLFILPLAALVTFYFPTLVLLRRAGRAGALRLFVMAYLFPLLQPVIWFSVAIAVFWVVGFLAIVIWSAAH